MKENPILKIYQKELKRSLLLSSKEEIELSEKIRKGDKRALDKLIEANLRFVMTVARNYKNQGVDLDDLISIGNIGLINAAKRFDGSKKYKFISYAVWWIRQQILLALADQSRIMRIPLSTIVRLYRMRRIRDSLIKKTGGNIDSATLAKATGYTIRDVDRLLNMEDKPVLLNAPVGDSGEDLVECFAAAEEESTDDIEERMKIISASMKNLSKREREIIKAYYGFESDVPQTLSEIGKRYGISRERVRQIKINAMRRMRHTLKLNKASEK